VPDDAVHESQLTLRYEEHYEPESASGYACEAAFSVETGDLGDVQALIVDIVDAGAHEIDRVEFDVADKDELRARARRQVVAAARHRAEVDAEEAGCAWGRWCISRTSRRNAAGTRPRRARTGGPGHVFVAAVVVLGFAIDG
jgi:hypothetical protein